MRERQVVIHDAWDLMASIEQQFNESDDIGQQFTKLRDYECRRRKLPALMRVLEYLSRLPGRPSQEVFVDLSCDDGRVVHEVCQAFPSWRCCGMDADAAVILLAQRRARNLGLDDQCSFHLRDTVKVSLDRATVVFLHARPAAMRFLQQRVLPCSGLPVGAVLLSSDHALGEFCEHFDIGDASAWTEQRDLFAYTWPGELRRPSVACVKQARLHSQRGSAELEAKKARIRSMTPAAGRGLELPNSEPSELENHDQPAVEQGRRTPCLPKSPKPCQQSGAGLAWPEPECGSRGHALEQSKAHAQALTEAGVASEESTVDDPQISAFARKTQQRLQVHAREVLLASERRAAEWAMDPRAQIQRSMQSLSELDRKNRCRAKNLSLEFDEWMASYAGAGRIVVLGDCHGCRTACLLSNLVVSHFTGCSAYSWVSGRHNAPSLRSLLGTAARGRAAVLLLSFGEIDCRVHSEKWDHDPESLSTPYVNHICDYISKFAECQPSCRVFPVVLAVPPAADCEGGATPLQGSLQRRVQATSALNASLDLA